MSKSWHEGGNSLHQLQMPAEIQHEASFRRFPVSATFHGGDSWEGTGIDFSDYARCGTQIRKQSGERRLDAPAWAFNPSMLRALIVRVMERRACFDGPQPGTDAERLARAQARIAEKYLPTKDATLTKMCKRLVALKNDPSSSPAVVKKLSQAIESLDSEIRWMLHPDRGASQLVGIVHHYYAVGMDSVGVAAELGIKPPAVRRVLWMMYRCWERMKTEVPSGWRGPRIRINLIRNQNYSARRCEKCNILLPTNRGRWCAACAPWRKRHKVKKVRPLILLRSATCIAKREAIVTSPEFIALFAAWKDKHRHSKKLCKYGHPICANNAYVGDLRREGKFSCALCTRDVDQQYKARQGAKRRAANPRLCQRCGGRLPKFAKRFCASCVKC